MLLFKINWSAVDVAGDQLASMVKMHETEGIAADITTMELFRYFQDISLENNGYTHWASQGKMARIPRDSDALLQAS